MSDDNNYCIGYIVDILIFVIVAITNNININKRN